jgi:hypothetical protein
MDCILFAMYPANLIHMIDSRDMRPDLCTQVCGSCLPANVNALQQRMSARAYDFEARYSWLRSNRLHFAALRYVLVGEWQHQHPGTLNRRDSEFIVMSSTVRDLSIYLVADLCMKSYFQHRVDAEILRHSRQSCRICSSLPVSVYQTLTASMVLIRLSYSNGLPAHRFRLLQSLMNGVTI